MDYSEANQHLCERYPKKIDREPMRREDLQ